MTAIKNIEAIQRHSLEDWKGDSLAQALAKSEGPWGGVWSLYGMGEEQVLSLLPEVRKSLDSKGQFLLALDPTGTLIGTRTFSDVLGVLIQEVERRGLVTSKIEERLEWLHSVQSGGVALGQDGVDVKSRDVMARLWCALNEVLPTVLVVFYPGRCGGQLAGCLDYLARYFYNDPIASLSPEMVESYGGRGGILSVSVSAGAPGFLVDDDVHWEMIDATQHVEASLREYLSNPKVLEKLIASTRGDMARLDELLEHLDGQVNYLWLRRVRGLSAEVRALVECVAMSSEPVEMSWVSHALKARGFGSVGPGAMKQVIKQGLVSRVMEMGSVRLRLAHPDWSEAIVEMLDATVCAQWHQSLYQAALAQSGASMATSRFVTVHALGAGDLEVAKSHGVLAIRALMREGQNEDAAKLVDRLFEQLEFGEVEELELRTLAVEAWVRQGKWALAHKQCEALETLVVGESGRIEWAGRMASLLLEMERFEDATVLLEAVIGELDESSSSYQVSSGRLLIELGDARYRLGEYKKGKQIGLEAKHALSGLDDALVDLELVRARLKAEHLIGRCCIMLAQYEEAEAIFVQNYDIAQTHFWEDLAAKAKANVGILKMMREEHEAALADLLDALDVAQRTPSMSTSNILVNIAYLYHFQYDYEQAIRYYMEALRAAKQRHEGRLYSLTFYNMMSLYRDIGAMDRASDMLERFFDETSPYGNQFIRSRACTQQLLLAHDAGNPADVVSLSQEIDFSQVQDITALHTQKLLLAWACIELEDEEGAVEHLGFVRDEVPGGDYFVQGLFHYVQAKIAFHRGVYDEVLTYVEQGESFASQERHFQMLMRFAWLRAQVYVASEEMSNVVEAATAFIHSIDTHGQQFVPYNWRSQFYNTSLFAEMTRWAAVYEVVIPESLRHHLDVQSLQRDFVTVASDAGTKAWRAQFSSIIGESERLYHLFHMVEKVAKGDTTVLLLGESGTGKELFAQAIHDHSARTGAPFIKVNCAAFVESLLIGELFGHEKGAFTGATGQKVGRFEMADGGTLFLDEVADISPRTQVALLRVLQEREFERVGGTETIQVDVRVVCATNKNLEELVKRGEFRLDLYYRLKGLVLELPALRERRRDIPRLMQAFSNAERPSNPVTFTREAMRTLMSYSWPGNVRELQNFAKSLLLFVEGDVVDKHHIHDFSDFFSHGEFSADVDHLLDDWESGALPPVTHSGSWPRVARTESLSEASEHSLAQEESESVDAMDIDSLEGALVDQVIAQETSLADFKKRFEIECIRRALVEAEGNVTKAASLLQMKRPRLSQIVNSTPELTTLKDSLT